MLWADDHLPWVRGKCLAMGLRLPEMDACDALDVIHVLLEEDSIESVEQRKEKNRVRDLIYRDLYLRPRRYSPGTGSPSGAGAGHATVSADGTPVKPYVPPTDASQLSGIVGSPVG